ncbi:MAG: hypothetical protein HY908_17310 [Myxococcales bacterium]|nr:hypothetical protein [Myxococcales bacterium]
MDDLEKRVRDTAPPPQPRLPSQLHGAIRARLSRAFDDGDLETPLHDIMKHVRLMPPPPNAPGDAQGIVGGVKDYKRRPESARLVRRDGAWFHFTITVRAGHDALLYVLGYDFELVLLNTVPPFVRFDLNLPGLAQSSHEPRSHVHPGHDEIRLPAPVLDPLEAIELMLSVRPVR